jgi:hypothetical protein
VKKISIFFVFITASITAACMCSEGGKVPDNQSIPMCMAQSDWPKLIAEMNRFAEANNLKLIGGIESRPDGKASLNVAVAQGYNYYFGDTLDLWITSDPFRRNVINYGAVGRHNPINHEEWELARALLREISPVASRAHGTKQNPRCPTS